MSQALSRAGKFDQDGEVGKVLLITETEGGYRGQAGGARGAAVGPPQPPHAQCFTYWLYQNLAGRNGGRCRPSKAHV